MTFFFLITIIYITRNYPEDSCVYKSTTVMSSPPVTPTQGLSPPVTSTTQGLSPPVTPAPQGLSPSVGQEQSPGQPQTIYGQTPFVPLRCGSYIFGQAGPYGESITGRAWSLLLAIRCFMISLFPEDTALQKGEAGTLLSWPLPDYMQPNINISELYTIKTLMCNTVTQLHTTLSLISGVSSK